MRCSAGRIWRRLGSPASPSTFRSRRERALSFLRFTTPAADASALPAEIAFLVAEGVPVDHLARAARL
ncbi:hypothetical protein ACFQ12_24315, partial [Methylobacterium trifolii]